MTKIQIRKRSGVMRGESEFPPFSRIYSRVYNTLNKFQPSISYSIDSCLILSMKDSETALDSEKKAYYSAIATLRLLLLYCYCYIAILKEDIVNSYVSPDQLPFPDRRPLVNKFDCDVL